MSHSIREEDNRGSEQSAPNMFRTNSAQKHLDQRSQRINSKRKPLSSVTMTSPMSIPLSGPISETLTGTTQTGKYEPILAMKRSAIEQKNSKLFMKGRRFN